MMEGFQMHEQIELEQVKDTGVRRKKKRWYYVVVGGSGGRACRLL